MQLLIDGLAAFRLTVLIAKDDGPGFIFWRLRKLPSKKSSLHEGISCPFCVSVWMAAPVALFAMYGQKMPLLAQSLGNLLLLWLALSAVAIILNQAFTRD